MPIIASTPRLLIREITVNDAASAYLLNLDPDVIKYTGDEAFSSIDEAKEFLQNYTHYSQYGFGRWALIEKISNNFIGWCGLKYTPELNEFDLGYRLMKSYWNQGYATEAGLKSLELGFNQFQMNTIVGRAMPENTASIRVLEKLGFTFVCERINDQQTEVIYELNKKDWLSWNQG